MEEERVKNIPNISLLSMKEDYDVIFNDNPLFSIFDDPHDDYTFLVNEMLQNAVALSILWCVSGFEGSLNLEPEDKHVSLVCLILYLITLTLHAIKHLGRISYVHSWTLTVSLFQRIPTSEVLI
jgi:hypothetical protein